MGKRQRAHSLSAQLFCGVLWALLAAAVVFTFCFGVSSQILNNTVYSQPFMNSLTDKQFTYLQSYVKEENVTVQNLHPLDIWCNRGDEVYLSIYVDNQIIYESPMTSQANLDPTGYDPAIENADREYDLTLADGKTTRAFLYYFTSEAYYYLSILVSGLAAFLVFSLCFISFVHRKLQYIKQLKSELDILAGGDLQYQVTVKGNDELYELAHGIDQMRESIVAHQELENKMQMANSELVTAMSHDLRTPLTSLLAYLELMERGKYEDEQQLRHFINRSLEKTLQIKSMADKLFEYFLVYSSEWEQPDRELIDADELFQQFWGEYAFSLENKGLRVVCDFPELKGKLQVNIDLLRRAFDNIYSNILKYADPAFPVELSYRRTETGVCLIAANSIPMQRDKKESTNIGLNTCDHIIRYHGGTFSAVEKNNRFCVTVTLPLAD